MSARRVTTGIKKVKLPAISQKQAQERYFIRLVELHPKYRLLIQSLKEGTKATVIAAHFAENGWLQVNERTFTEAIRVYKIKHPEAIDEAVVEGLDSHVDANQPPVDLKAQLQQLLRFQRQRLGIAYTREKEAGALFGSTAKELEQTINIIETIGKLEGLIQDTGNKKGGGHEDATVLENLNRVKRDQTTRDRLHQSVKQLVEVKT